MKRLLLKTKLKIKVLLTVMLLGTLVSGNIGTIITYAYYANHVITGLTGMAAPMEGTDTTEGCAYAGDGTYANPYKIAVSGDINGNTPNTRPSAFWGIWGGGPGNPTSISHFKVIFENRKNQTLDGDLISSMTYDLIDHDSLNDGLSTQYVTNPSNIWDGSWTYAFRLAPWTAFDTSTGDLRLAFSWKGQFSFYWKDWEFKFNAVDQTSGLSPDKQLHPGDIVALTYYGGYDTNQTSRGTNYTVNFSTTDSNAQSTIKAVVDNEGYAVFSGQNMVSYGGNYIVSKVYIPVNSINISAASNATSITQRNGSLQLFAALAPLDTTQKDYTWSIVSGDSLATIDPNGLLLPKGIGNGDVVVRATSTDNTQIYGEYTVAITNNELSTPIKSIQISAKNNAISIAQKNGTLQLNASLTPSDTTQKNYIWSIESGDNLAAIDQNGLLQAKENGNGVVVVRATSTDNTQIYGEYSVAITNNSQYVPVKEIPVSTTLTSIPIEKIQINAVDSLTSIDQKKGTLQLSTSLAPSNTTQKDYTWSIIRGDSLATINQSGMLQATGKGNGDVVVRATSTDNSQVYGEYTVSISNNLLSLDITFDVNGGSNLSKTSISVEEGSPIGALPTCDRKGYIFDGWYSEATGESKISSKTICTTSATYYAKWTKINVNQEKIKSIKAGKKYFTVDFNKVNGASQYQIRYSIKSNMSDSKVITINGTKKKVTNLKSGKKYYVQVRAYTVDSTGSKVYGSWSSKKIVKVE